MKKIYSFVLMAAMLLIGTTAWAVEVDSWSALKSAIATPNAAITLAQTITCEDPDGSVVDFQGATINCGGANKYYVQINSTGELTWKNATFTNGNSAVVFPGSGLVMNFENITISNTIRIGITTKNNTLNLDADCRILGGNSVVSGSVYSINAGDGTIVNNRGVMNYGFYANSNTSPSAIVTVNNYGTINQNASFKSHMILTNYPGASFTFKAAGESTAVYDITNGGDLVQNVKPAGKVNLTELPVPVAQIDATEYTSLEDAIAAVSAGETIELLKSVNLTPGTYDLNSATLDCRNYHVNLNTASGSYTFQNGDITGSSYMLFVGATGMNISLENVQLSSYTSSEDLMAGSAIYCGANGSHSELTIDDNSSITSTNQTGTGIYAVRPVTITNHGEINGFVNGIYYVHGGTASSADSMYVYNDGTITCRRKADKSAGFGVYTYNHARVTNDGTISTGFGASFAVQARQTKLINNNIITNTYTSATAYAIYCSGSKFINNGTIDGIYVYGGAPNVENYGIFNKGMYNPGDKKNSTITNGSAGTFTQSGATYNGKLTINNEGTFNLIGGTYGDSVKITNSAALTLNGAIFKGYVVFNGTENTTIVGDEFSKEPVGSMGYINPGDGAVKFAAGVGSLTIAPGYAYRELDKMVCGVSAPVEITHANGSKQTAIIEEAFLNALDGDVITLLEDVTSYSSLWLGTAEQNDDKISLTLDLNGHTLTSAKNVKRTIELTHGALYIKNSVPGQGGIVHLRSNADPNNASDVIYVCGSTNKDVNPRTAAIANLFTYLLVDEGVNISSNGAFVNGVSVFENSEDGNKVSGVNYYTTIYKDYRNWSGKENKQMGVANGVRIDIKGNIDVQKYGVKPNGNIRASLEFLPEHAGDGILASDTAYSTYIHIFPTAVVRTSNEETATAIYASGYARWLIEGTCQGATGVYAKSGVIDFNDAIIESTYTDSAYVKPGKGGGIDAAGNAVVVESNGSYTGEHSLLITGDTKVSTEADGGSAIIDVVDKNQTSKVDDITINGGNFTGGENGYAVVISSATASEDAVTVNGVTVTGGVTVGGSSQPEDVAAIMGANTHTTEIENPDGSKTVVVSAGAAPAATTEWTDVAALAEGSDAKWTGFTPGVIANGESVKLGELQIISADGTTGKELQQLTVENGAVLNVERLIMNDYARIIVEAGGQLIVTGEQGINAPNVANILLKTSETAQAILLFHPNVSSNRHPMAMVELKSKAYYNSAADKYIWQRFGVPTYLTGDQAIKRTDISYTAPTAWRKIDHQDWVSFDATEGLKPFTCYGLTTNQTSAGALYTFSCPLVGNDNATLVLTDEWNYFANSYSAPIDLVSTLASLNTNNPNVSGVVYLYRASDNWWYEINNAAYAFDDNNELPRDIDPMQAFIFQRRSEGNHPIVNYKNQIYDPIAAPTPAPARKRGNTLDKVMIEIVAADGSKDVVRLIENAQFSSEFDNGWDAAKYLNDNSFNFFANANAEKMGIMATDNLEGTTLSMITKDQTSFTMTFSHVNGLNYAIRDNMTGTETIIAEGATYMFSVPANASVEGRFEVVPVKKAPTAIENIEETAAKKGIYTITGQYVGNDYYKLPAGVYVVDGKKIVK